MWPFSKNFKYLEDLIRNGVGEIVLDSNIVLDNAEVSKYPYGIPVRDSLDIVIDGRGHTIDAKGKTRIFSFSGSNNITIKNIKFKNGSNDVGGAIYNTSILNIENCKFEGNVAVHYGGAIVNEYNTLRIIDSTFSKNAASEGGAVCNDDGDMYISDSTIKNNITKDNGAVDNCGKLLLRNVDFENNETENLDHDYDVYNYEELHIDGDYSSNQQKSIFNEGHIQTSGLRDRIVNQGEITESPVKDFAYLDDLINDSSEDILKLEYDIALNCLADEDSTYHDGIKIYASDLIIDGCGHTVDARGKTPIFRISGENIKIKNITLKNGESFVEGGAIMNEGELIICNSRLCNNQANKNGGAIFNCKKLTVINCIFSNNGVGTSGGAIFNDGDLNVIDSTFSGNSAYLGCAILSKVEFDSNLKNCNFENKKNEVVYEKNPPW